MNTDCLCLDTHEACHSVANIQPVLYIGLPDRQMGWPPNDLWYSTFVEARPWILSSGLHHSQMFCQNGCRRLEPTWARCCLRGGHMTSADIPTDFLGYTRHFRLKTANCSGSYKQQCRPCSCREEHAHIPRRTLSYSSRKHFTCARSHTRPALFWQQTNRLLWHKQHISLRKTCSYHKLSSQHEIRGWRRIK